ncbi:YncE family protein [Kitasatospora sp. NPDC048365]|uniref:YncE family protein n=1 Tax=Kitasatospora sp. NPDC048365 TaxID=3364050 RepID=UPI0037141803
MILTGLCAREAWLGRMTRNQDMGRRAAVVLCVAAALMGPGGLAGAADGTLRGDVLVCVADLRSDAVSVVDPGTGVVVDSVPVGDGPDSVAVSPDGSRVYVTDSGSDTVSVISTRHCAVTATVAVGDGPNSLAVGPGGSQVCVSDFNADTLSVVDTATARATDTVAVGSGPTGVAAARGKRA